MRSGRCSACGGTEIYAARDAVSDGGSTRFSVYGHIEPGFRGMRRPLPVDRWSFFCAGCGHLETYLIDEQARSFIRQRWLPVPAAEAPRTQPGTGPRAPTE